MNISKLFNKNSAISYQRATPGGFMGGATVGRIISLLVGSKSTRKIAGKVATYGGTTLLGGLAFKAYDNWKHQRNEETYLAAERNFHRYGMQHSDIQENDFKMIITKVMIAAAKANGSIDSNGQKIILNTVNSMSLSIEDKALVLDMLRDDISLQEITSAKISIELKSEIYLAARLIIGSENVIESAFLKRLIDALQLPESLARQLDFQAHETRPQLTA